METNQKQSQELPAQNIIAIEPKQQSYDTLKAARIAETLSELLNPEYIMLFGKLADGTPHSDIRFIGSDRRPDALRLVRRQTISENETAVYRSRCAIH